MKRPASGNVHRATVMPYSVTCEAMLLLGGPLLTTGWGYVIVPQHTFLKLARFGSVWEHLVFQVWFAVTHASVHDDGRGMRQMFVRFIRLSAKKW